MGRLASIGTPADIFEQVEQIKAEGLDVPAHNEIVHELANRLQVPLYPKGSRDLGRTRLPPYVA
jgi:hypothetical protein